LKAQTAQIESTTANPGATVSFDIDVAGLPANVGAVSLFIGYDPNVLTFTGSTPGDPEFAGYFINDMAASHQVGIQWTDPYGADINGTILSLEFQYNTLGGTCDLTFGPGCEFTDIDLNSLLVSFTSGSVGPNAGLATITIDELPFEVAGPITRGVTGANFAQDAGALTLYIEFDETMMQFSGYSSTLTGVLVNGNNSTGIIGVTYSNPAGESLNTQFLTLNFNYDGTGETELIFQAGCEVAYIDLTNPIVSYDNGKVKPLATAYHMTIGDLVTNPGNVIGIPVTAGGYPANMGAITLFIGYNPAHLDFVNITDGTISGVAANLVSPGLIGITWTDFGGVPIDGIIFTLNFDYNFGASEITFEGGCEITDRDLVPLPTTYHDGSISPTVGGPEISLPSKTGTIGQQITFPITAKNFIMDVGAISLFIGYDDDVLTYTGSTPGTLNGYFINNMPATSHIGIQWAEYPGIDIDPSNNDILLTLNFIYNGGVCDLTFDAGCEFAQDDLTLIPVAYFDGGVISGTLFDITAFLEGPFNGTDMNALLGSYIPLSQPYNGVPWNYTGTETVGSIPANVVDWVLLEIRESAVVPSVIKKAAFILTDGSIVDLDGTSKVIIPASFSGNVFVVVYHRNHIGMMSSTSVPLIGDAYTWDFTSAQSQAYTMGSDGQKDLFGLGIFGMTAGDADGNGDINLSDFLDVFVPEFGSPYGYYGGDADLNSDVNLSDGLDLIVPNFGTLTQIP
jgi:hypothetical protein